VKFSAPVVGGIVFAILFVLGMIMMNLPVGGGASSDDEIREFYANSDDRTRVVISTYLLALAAVAFMPFLAGLYLGALIAGIAFIALLMAGAAALGAIAGGIQLGDEPELLADTGIARFLGHTGYALILIMGAFSAAAMIAMASARIIQHPGIAARWVAWAGFVLAAILLVAVIFLPMVALPIWVLIACFTILPGNRVGESATLGSRA
jgi:MFS family permease